MDWKKITDNKEIIKLLKQREAIEDKVREIDDMVLIRYELEKIKEQ